MVFLLWTLNICAYGQIKSHLKIPKSIDENALMITDWEAGSRYDIHFSIRIDTLKKMYQIVNEWYGEVYSAGIR